MNAMNGHTRDDTQAASVMMPFAISPALQVQRLTPVPDVTAAALPAPERPARERARSLRDYPWPLLVIAAPAAVAIWSGWVGLGGMCGFGPIRPLPGIADGFTINTAITLPVGVEAYGAYALAVWLGAKRIAARTRRWARLSAAGALALGCLGQIAFHLLSAARVAQAPWPVVTIVSCLPVVSLALAAALAHMVIADIHGDAEPDIRPDIEPGPEVDNPVAVQVDIEAPSRPDISMDIEADKPAPVVVDKPKPAARTSKRTPTAAEKVAAVLRRDPGLSNVEVAKKAGVSAKTVQRVRPQIADEAGDLA